MTQYREIYRIEQLPIFQNRMFHSEGEARDCVRGDVILAQDLETGLISNQAFRPELMEYDADYQNEQAVSGVFQEHLNKVSDIIQKHFQDHSLIEVGCGKGYFLELLQVLGFKITGMDPTYEGSNPSVFKEEFNPETGLHADGIVLRHVLEHVQDPVRFLSIISQSNGGTGKIYIEVPCFDWICEKRAWFDLFYEHVNYFRLRDFHQMFDKVYESGHTFGDQYIYAVADLASLKTPTLDEPGGFEFPKDFLDTVDRYAAEVRTQKLKQGSPAVIWGGASKGVIFALFMERAGATIDTVIDINPEKRGLYLAGTGLKVESPAEVIPRLTPGADLFVMNSNYLKEIQESTAHKFNYLLVDQ